MLWARLSRTGACGQGHSESETRCDTQLLQDVSTHNIWDSYYMYLELYRRYARDIIVLELRQEVHVTVT